MNRQLNDKIKLKVETENQDSRLDAFISKEISHISRNYAQKLIENGHIFLNENICLQKKSKVKNGDNIIIQLPEPKKIETEGENIPIEIIYEDDFLMVVNKPRGMVVHPANGNPNGTLVNALIFHNEGKLSNINGELRPGIVHRIDKDTSGLLMIAKNNIAHSSLANQLKEHSIKREYIALCYDNIKEDKITIDKPIGRDPKNRLRKCVNGIGERNAITHIEVIRRFGKFTLIKATLETGRTHQIRVHLSYMKHPLVGDRVYGPKNQIFGIEGQLLHAGVIGFVHPDTGIYMEFKKEIPEYFVNILTKLDSKL